MKDHIIFQNLISEVTMPFLQPYSFGLTDHPCYTMWERGLHKGVNTRSWVNGSQLGVWGPHCYSKILTYSFLNLHLYALIISYFIQVGYNIIYFHAQIVTNLLFFPHHSLSTSLYSGTRCFWLFLLLLHQPCNHLFFQGSLVLFSGQQYIETKIWMLGVPVALRISLPSLLSVIRTMNSDWYL